MEEGKEQKGQKDSVRNEILVYSQEVVIINLYIQYLRELVLSLKAIDRIHN